MVLNLVVSGLLVVLLIVMIYSAWLLDKRLRTLRDNGGELKQLIQGLNEATERAQGGIVQLKAAAREFENDWGQSVGKARALADELNLIIETGNNLANRLTQDLTDNPKNRFTESTSRQGKTAKQMQDALEEDAVRALRRVR